MSAGSLTYGFLTKTKHVSGNYFVSSKDGFKKLKSLDVKYGESITKDLLNKRLAEEDNLLIRAQESFFNLYTVGLAVFFIFKTLTKLLKHFSAVDPETSTITDLKFQQESYQVVQR